MKIIVMLFSKLFRTRLSSQFCRLDCRVLSGCCMVSQVVQFVLPKKIFDKKISSGLFLFVFVNYPSDN